MKTLSVTALAAAAVLLAQPARAQSAADADSTAPNSLRKGAMSFSVEGPFQGSRVLAGVWKMVGDRTNLGVIVGLGANTASRDNNDGADWNNDEATANLGLAVRCYTNPLGRITPFVAGEVSGYGWRTTSEVEDGESSQKMSALGASVRGGLGVEWFPTRRVSLSGSTGVELNWLRQRFENELSAGETSETTDNRFGFSTFSSGLGVQIYF